MWKLNGGVWLDRSAPFALWTTSHAFLMCDADAAWYHHKVHIIGFIRLTAVQQTLAGISLTLPAKTVCNCIKPFLAYSLIFEIPACCTSAFVGLQFLKTSRYSYSAFSAMQRNSSPPDTPSLKSIRASFMKWHQLSFGSASFCYFHNTC